MSVFDDDDVERFVAEGFLLLEGAFPRELAGACRDVLWREMGLDPAEPATWTRPVVRLAGHAEEPFRRAADTPRLRAAFDQLAGRGRWSPLLGLGTFPIRFPSDEDPGDTGWHVDAGFYADDGAMRLTLDSRGRVLLLLFLLSDVGATDAPTRIRVGSHLEPPRLLEAAGAPGLSFMELAERLDPRREHREVPATGREGDVYLCHPFLVHAAQRHRGTAPRFLAQPPLVPAEPLSLRRDDGEYSPVERAIRIGLGWHAA